jgi:hypothetical protein
VEKSVDVGTKCICKICGVNFPAWIDEDGDTESSWCYLCTQDHLSEGSNN